MKVSRGTMPSVGKRNIVPSAGKHVINAKRRKKRYQYQAREKAVSVPSAGKIVVNDKRGKKW